MSYSPACSEIPISGGFNYGTALRTEKKQHSSRDSHFLLPGFWKPTQLGLQFKMRFVLWVCGQQVACRRTDAPSGLGVLRATLTPGDHAGSDPADGGRVAPWLWGGPSGLCGSSPPSGLVPPWVFLLPSTVSRVMGAKVQAHPLKTKVNVSVPHASGSCFPSVCQIATVPAVSRLMCWHFWLFSEQGLVLVPGFLGATMKRRNSSHPREAATPALTASG